MPERQTWTHQELIPRVTQAISVERYTQEDIEPEIQRLNGLMGSMGNGGPLVDAANAWTAAKDKMVLVQERVHAIGSELAEVWSSEASQESQWALMLIHDAAGDLADTAHRVSDFTGKSAELMRQMLHHAPSEDDPGFMEQALGAGGRWVGQHGPNGSPFLAEAGQTIGGAIGHANDAVGEMIAGAFGIENDRTAEYRAALAALNEQYVAESWRMPPSISAELPQIDPAGGGPEPIQDLDPIGGPPLGGPPMSGPGTSLTDPPSTGMGSGASLGDPPSPSGDLLPGPGSEGLPGTGPPGAPGSGTGTPGASIGEDGYSGGLAGTGMPSSGVGSGGLGPSGSTGPGVPGGAGGGGMSPGGAGIGGTSPASVRPGMPTGMVPMGSGTGGRGSGATGRSTGGMMPMGGAGAGGGRGTGGRGAGAGTGGRVTGARPGMGGMMPAGGRGDGDQKHSSHDSWLVEDDDPFSADDDVPPGIIK